MGFQPTVFANTGFGVVGSVFDNSPIRAQPFILDSDDADNNVFGRAFTTLTSAQGIARAGNPDDAGVFVGILFNPKASTTSGTVADGSLAPTLTLPNNSNVELITMGQIIVTLPVPVNVGDLVIYDKDTGILTTIAPGDALPTDNYFAFATVTRFDADSGLAVIELTPTLVIPAP